MAKVPLKAGASFLRHKEWSWSINHYHKVLWATWVAAAAVSYYTGWPLLLGLVCAQVWAIHQEAVVNVVGHTYGFGAYRTYGTYDCSVNRNLLALFTWGQSLHNNHHASPRSPDFACGYTLATSIAHLEFDPSMLWVRLIRKEEER